MNLQVSVVSTAHWENGGNGLLTIKNLGDAINNWSLKLKTENYTVGSFWRLTKSGSGNEITITPPDWKNSLASGEEFTSGLAYSGNNATLMTSSLTEGVTVETTSSPNDDTTNNNTGESGSGSGSGSGSIGSVGGKLNNKVTFGYFSEWSIYDRQFSVDKVPADNLTHLVYAFMLPNPNQDDFNTLKNNYPFPPKPYSAPPTIPEAQLTTHDQYAHGINIQGFKNLRAKYPHLKLIMSVGGWTLSWTFSKIVKDPVLRSRLVKSCVDFCIQHGFDGIDIDWEFVGKQGAGYNYVDEKNDGPNFVVFLKELRTECDARSPNKHLEITAATGCNPIVIANYVNTEPYMDYLLLMTYDFSGAWDTYAGNLSGLYHDSASKMNDQFNVHASVENAKKAGYPASKLCVGCPMYGRGWASVNPDDLSKNHYGPASGSPVSISGAAGEPGLSSWRHMREEFKKEEWVTGVNDVAKSAWAHNKNTKQTWSYETPETAVAKAQYVVDNDLGGMLFWELSDDTRDGVDNILDAVVDVLVTANEEVNNNNDEPADNNDEPTNNNDEPADNNNDEPVDNNDEPPVNNNDQGQLTVKVLNNSNAPVTIQPGEEMTFVLQQ